MCRQRPATLPHPRTEVPNVPGLRVEYGLYPLCRPLVASGSICKAIDRLFGLAAFDGKVNKNILS